VWTARGRALPPQRSHLAYVLGRGLGRSARLLHLGVTRRPSGPSLIDTNTHPLRARTAAGGKAVAARTEAWGEKEGWGSFPYLGGSSVSRSGRANITSPRTRKGSIPLRTPQQREQQQGRSSGGAAPSQTMGGCETLRPGRPGVPGSGFEYPSKVKQANKGAGAPGRAPTGAELGPWKGVWASRGVSPARPPPVRGPQRWT
jgi:hypothetical protein